MKSLIEQAFFLKKIKIFADLDLELLLAIAEKLHVDDYDAQEKIFIPGQVANRIYFIEKGEVEIFDKDHVFQKKLISSDYFGDESLFNEQPRGYFAECKKDSILFTLSRSHLLAIISECPSVSVALLQAFASELSCRHQKRSFTP